MKATLMIGCLLVALGICPLAAQAPRAGPPPDDPVLVEVGSETVAVATFLHYLRQSQPGIQFHRLPAAEQEKLLADFVDHRLLALRARELGLDRDPQVRARIEFFVDRVLAQALRERVQEGIAVGEEEILAYHREHREEFRLPDRLLLEHLVYSQPESARWARRQLESGRTYDYLADQKGQDPNLVYSERGWFTPDLILPELRAAVEQLASGQVGEIHETGYGHHVLRLAAREPGRYREPAEVEAAIVETLRQAKAGELVRRVLDETREKVEVRLFLDRLRAQGGLDPRGSPQEP